MSTPAGARVRRRLFVAVALDDDARAACARVAECLRAKRWPARWVNPPNYHLTVAFLGTVDADRVEAVASAVREVAGGVTSFHLPIDAVGAFPNARKPRVAWAGPSRPVPEFTALCSVVRGALAAYGFTFDTRADPHVTLARADGSAPLPETPPPRVRVPVDALVLYESVTERGGVRYVSLERCLLGEPARSRP